MQNKKNEMSKLNISLALEEVSKSIEGGNKRNTRNLFSVTRKMNVFRGKTENDMRKI